MILDSPTVLGPTQDEKGIQRIPVTEVNSLLTGDGRKNSTQR